MHSFTEHNECQAFDCSMLCFGDKQILSHGHNSGLYNNQCHDETLGIVAYPQINLRHLHLKCQVINFMLTNETLPSSLYVGSPSIFQPSGGVTYPGGSVGKLYTLVGGV